MNIVYAVPCHRRAAEVEGHSAAPEELLELDAEGDGWVAPQETGHAAAQEAGIPDMDEPASSQQPGSVSQLANPADDDDVPDIDDLAIEEEDDEVRQFDPAHAKMTVES